jgi:hypothetical protein
MFITSEGSGAVLKVESRKRRVSVLASGLETPRGIDYAPDGKLLVSSGDSIVRSIGHGCQPRHVHRGERTTSARSCFLAGHREATATAIDTTQIGTQHWVVGDGSFNGRVFEFDALSATGTAFGPDARFLRAHLQALGSIVRIELLSCSQARIQLRLHRPPTPQDSAPAATTSSATWRTRTRRAAERVPSTTRTVPG